MFVIKIIINDKNKNMCEKILVIIIKINRTSMLAQTGSSLTTEKQTNCFNNNPGKKIIYN